MVTNSSYLNLIELFTKFLKQKKAIELANSELFDVHVWSEYPEVNRLVDSIYLDLSTDQNFNKNSRLRKKHIKVLVLDLYVNWSQDPTKYSSVYLRHAYYTELESRYNKLHISKLNIEVIKAFQAREYIELVPGHYAREPGFTSHTTRIRSAPKLITLFQQAAIPTEAIERYPTIEVLILKDYSPWDDERVIQIAYSDSDDSRIIPWRENLVAYNNLLRRTYIDIPSAPKNGIACKQSLKSKLKGHKPKRISINQHDKFVRRIFNYGDWNLGGRFYGGWWQRVSEEWRSRIRIWNYPVSEIDYKGLHINLLYRRLGINYQGDPYLLDTYEHTDSMRMLLKQVLLCSINAINKTEAIQAINKEINFNLDEYYWVRDESLNISELVDALANKHPSISEQFFFKSQGIKLQNLDSMIAEKIIIHFTRLEIPVLCVHDSFVIQADKTDDLKIAMENAYQEVFSELGIESDIPNTDLTGLDHGQFQAILSNPVWRELLHSIYAERYQHPVWAEKLRSFKEMTQIKKFEPNYYQADNNFGS